MHPHKESCSTKNEQTISVNFAHDLHRLMTLVTLAQFSMAAGFALVYLAWASAILWAFVFDQ